MQENIEMGPIAMSSTSCKCQPSLFLQNRFAIPSTFKTVNDLNQHQRNIKSGTNFDHEKTLRLLDDYVKNVIFHKVVFILSPELVSYSIAPWSLCQIVCDYLNIPSTEQARFWTFYSKFIVRNVNWKRADVSNAMKKSYLGKCINFILIVY